MNYYIKCAADGTPLSFFTSADELTGYETQESAGGTQPYIIPATLVNGPAPYRATAPNLTADPAQIDYPYLSLAAVVAWKKAELSTILETKKSPFTWNDGTGNDNYRLSGDLRDWMFMVTSAYFSNGGAVGWRLDGTQTIWPLPGLFPRDNADLQVVTVNKTNGAVTTLTYAASNPGAAQYTITTTLGVGTIITLGAAGTSGNFLVAAVVPGTDWPWLTDAVVKKTWTQAQYRGFLWAVYGHLWACAGRYYALHTAIVEVTGTDQEKIEKLTDPENAGYIDLTTGWPVTAVN